RHTRFSRDWSSDVCSSDLLDGYDETTERLDPEGTWVHIDHIEPEVAPLPVIEGIPESLGTALADWIGYRGTPDEEVAEFIGWPRSEERRVGKEGRWRRAGR